MTATASSVDPCLRVDMSKPLKLLLKRRWCICEKGVFSLIQYMEEMLCRGPKMEISIAAIVQSINVLFTVFISRFLFWRGRGARVLTLFAAYSQVKAEYRFLQQTRKSKRNLAVLWSEVFSYVAATGRTSRSRDHPR